MSRNELRRFSVPGRLTPTSWQLPPSLSYEDWVRYGQALTQMGGAIQWALGDWWIYGEHAYGERIAAVRNGAFGHYTFNSLKNLGSVARRVERSCRHDLLSFEHHTAVAALSPAQQKRWLERAVRGEQDDEGVRHPWPVSQLRKEIKAIAPPQQQEEDEDEGEEYTDEDYQHQLLALAGGAAEFASNILQHLQRSPGAASSELLARARAVVEVWSTVINRLEEVSGGR